MSVPQEALYESAARQIVTKVRFVSYEMLRVATNDVNVQYVDGT